MSSKTDFEERHFKQRTCRNADQAEFLAVIGGSAPLDAGFYDDEVAGAVDDYEQEMDEGVHLGWHQRDLAKDTAVGMIQEEVERRQALLGESYPFRLEENSIVYSASANKVYEFCLAASIQSDITKKPFAYIPRAFEKITTAIVEQFLGEGAHGMHVGAPRLGATPSRFYDAMSQVHERTGEWVWNPLENYPTEHPSTGDEGLDFLVARPFGDGRLGQLFLIGQCACGDDWEDKWNDLNLSKLGKWFHPLSIVDPVRVFATPHVLSAGNLKDCQIEAGLAFDRVRLVLVGGTCSLETSLAAWPAVLKELAGLVIRPQGSPLPLFVPPSDIATQADVAAALRAAASLAANAATGGA